MTQIARITDEVGCFPVDNPSDWYGHWEVLILSFLQAKDWSELCVVVDLDDEELEEPYDLPPTFTVTMEFPDARSDGMSLGLMRFGYDDYGRPFYSDINASPIMILMNKNHVKKEITMQEINDIVMQRGY